MSVFVYVCVCVCTCVYELKGERLGGEGTECLGDFLGPQPLTKKMLLDLHSTSWLDRINVDFILIMS